MKSVKNFLLGLLGLAVLYGLAVLWNLFMGRDIGEFCRSSSDCRKYAIGAASCLEADGRSYCTVDCSSDSDCKEGWSCQASEEISVGRGGVTYSSDKVSQSCVIDSWDCQSDADCPSESWFCEQSAIRGSTARSCSIRPEVAASL